MLTPLAIDSKVYSLKYRSRPHLGADARRPLRLHNAEWATSNLNVYRQYEMVLTEVMKEKVEEMDSSFVERKKSSKHFTAVYSCE